jgi:vacuolar-type H+-ATPase subunit E/Vma4
VALADILKRIDRDTESEAGAIISTAKEQADRARDEARREAAAYVDAALDRAQREVADEARTRLASARLRGRDRVLTEKRVLIERVLADAVGQLEELPDERYAALIAREIAAAARGGERVRLARRDSARLADPLAAQLRERGVDVQVAGDTDDVAAGVVLVGERMRVEISPASLMQTRRVQLEAHVTEVLFGEKD